MIYMEPHQLGWTPLRDSYMDTLPDSLGAQHRQLVRVSPQWGVVGGLELTRLHAYSHGGQSLSCDCECVISCR